MSENYVIFISVAYGLTAAVIGGVALRIILEHHRLRAELARLERAGIKEQSDAS
jgi:heme exporter protein CcmD